MILRYSLIASALLLAACGRQEAAPDATADAAPAAAGNQVVYVYNWSDYVAEDTLANFEAETGIRVVYDTYDANEMLEAKLMAGASGYDVVFPSARPFAQRHIQAGIYAPLDKAQLPNLANLDADVLEGLQDVDPGNQHAVPYMWGTTGLGINVAKVKAALGEDAPLDSWSLLFDPANAAKLASCGIAVLDDEQETFAAALIWKGRDANALTGDETQVVTEAFRAIRPHIRYFHSSRYIDDLANGDICVAMGYSGDVFQARDAAVEAENGIEIEYIIPVEGAVRWVDLMAIPADAPHAANAHAFINYLLKPEVAAGIVGYVSYASPNTAALPLVDPEIAGDPGVYPSAEVMDKLVDPVTLPQETTRERVRAWTSIKTGQ
ncbi:polyamine ABC transporter substrate-binding protein [Arenimonas sp. SCN 70-307]|uniref:polyamine ABC transporter substrate-binding protein n=1 Tax=Arenimonas sp. SCN 70-307 TaxID=1660089 RepID=UPI000B05F7F7|nr:polyamine ABC transporter substrate-binding protein [Arenimonas sp. SCN 70-307]